MNKSEFVRLSVVTLVSLLVIAGLLVSKLIVTGSREVRSRIRRVEDALAEQSFQLTPLAAKLSPGAAAVGYRIPAPKNSWQIH